MAPVTEDGGWSALAEGWAARWGGVSAPARQALITACAIGPGTRVLDVGCGSGEFLAELAAAGARAIGVDSAPAMVAIAARHGDAREADAAALPFEDDSFDVVTAVTVLHLTDELDHAVLECARVLRPGGLLGIAEWDDTGRSDLAVIEQALEAAPAPSGPPHPSPLDLALDAADFRLVSQGEVEVRVRAADAGDLATTVLLGEDEATIGELCGIIGTAAEPFRRVDGSYELTNTFRWRVVSRG